MKDEFKQYLELVKAPEVVIKRAEVIYEFYKNLFGEGLEMFVSETTTDDGQRHYRALWFFSKQACMEAKDFIGRDNFDFALISKSIDYWEIMNQEYDFKKVTDKSRMHLVFRLKSGVQAELNASKENCDSLRDVFKKYILVNLHGT